MRGAHVCREYLTSDVIKLYSLFFAKHGIHTYRLNLCFYCFNVPNHTRLAISPSSSERREERGAEK